MDPSKAIYAAANLTKDIPGIHLIKASAENIPFEDETFDLVISLGVLHHIPDTQKALNTIVKKVNKGGQCLTNDKWVSTVRVRLLGSLEVMR